MKRLKKMIAVVLTIAIVVTFVPQINFGVNADTAKAFAITSPTDNALVAAGHFDIKWSKAEENTVKQYTVYLDDEKVGSTTNTSLDCYTTKVKMHSAYVEAEYTNGQTTKTATIKFAVSKKGLGLATNMGANIDLKDMGCSWYYNWGTGPSGGNQYRGVEYVPMIWSENNGNSIKNKLNSFVNSGYKYVLDFNEPDLPDQCNMSVNDVFNLWPNMMNDKINVSSPVTATWPTESDWFKSFMTKIDAREDLDFDFISIHCYPKGWDGGADMAKWFAKDVVDAAWEKYHKPIWITEFSKDVPNPTSQTAQKTAEFWAAVIPLLDERDYVERYAGFCFNNTSTGLWNYGTGKLTLAGEMYRSYGNPEGYEPSTEEEPEYTLTTGTRKTLLSNSLFINNVECTDYVNQNGVTATATSKNGDGAGAEKAIDGDINSRWESVHKSDPQSITVDLGTVRNIKQLQIIWEDASAAKYTIDVSNDGNNFTTVATLDNSKKGQNRYDTITLKEMTSGRYVRITGLSRTTDYGYSIFDIGIYGTVDKKVDDTESAETTTRRPYVTMPPTTTEPAKPTESTTKNADSSTTVIDKTEPSTEEPIATTTGQKKKITVGKTKVTLATHKKLTKKIRITLKRVKGAKKYQVQFAKNKKFKKIVVRKTTKKIRFTVKNKNFKKSKKIYVRARAVVVVKGKTKYSKWTKAKKVRNK